MTTDWICYGKDNKGVDKLFRLLDDRLYFAFEKSFNMILSDFEDCVLQWDNIPISEEEGTVEHYFKKIDELDVSLERISSYNKGEPLQLGISKRHEGKWVSWIRFTVEELQCIISNIPDKN